MVALKFGSQQTFTRQRTQEYPRCALSLSQNQRIQKEIKWEATMICHHTKAMLELFIPSMEWIP